MIINKYQPPILYQFDQIQTAIGGCADGATAGQPACYNGPEAAGPTGCGAGAAAIYRCVSGAAAGSSCNAGEGNGTTPVEPIRNHRLK